MRLRHETKEMACSGCIRQRLRHLFGAAKLDGRTRVADLRAAVHGVPLPAGQRRAVEGDDHLLRGRAAPQPERWHAGSSRQGCIISLVALALESQRLLHRTLPQQKRRHAARSDSGCIISLAAHMAAPAAAALDTVGRRRRRSAWPRTSASAASSTCSSSCRPPWCEGPHSMDYPPTRWP